MLYSIYRSYIYIYIHVIVLNILCTMLRDVSETGYPAARIAISKTNHDTRPVALDKPIQGGLRLQPCV